MIKKHFGWPRPIVNLKSGETYYLFPNTDEYRTSQDDVEVARLCNQPEIYDFLFRTMLAGAPYGIEHAKGFLEWSNEGWKSSQYFVFLLRDAKGTPVGCIDIKGNDLQASEIGYWCSSEVTGLMTNTVKSVSQLAKSVGFRKLVAITLVNNQRSQSVLKNNGFSDVGEFEDDGVRKRKYEKALISDDDFAPPRFEGAHR